MPEAVAHLAWNVATRPENVMEPEQDPACGCCSSLYTFLQWCCYPCPGHRQTGPDAPNDHPVVAPSHQEAGPSGERLSPERHLLLPKGTPTSARVADPSSSGLASFLVQQADSSHSGSKGRQKPSSAGQSDPGVTPRKGSKRGVKQVPSGLSLASDEDDYCSTCLDGYNEDNPKIWTQCGHHFHLACIYEWLNRKQTCPICDLPMSFDELL